MLQPTRRAPSLICPPGSGWKMLLPVYGEVAVRFRMILPVYGEVAPKAPEGRVRFRMILPV